MADPGILQEITPCRARQGFGLPCRNRKISGRVNQGDGESARSLGNRVDIINRTYCCHAPFAVFPGSADP
jgi:hypothetical protein